MLKPRRIHERLQHLVRLERRSKRVAYALTVIGVSLDNMNTSSSITTYFSMLEHFDSTNATVSWTMSAYALTLGAMLMVSGKLTDILGPHRVVLVALSLMSISSLICAVLQNLIALIVVRAIQGMFASALIPSAFALAGNYYQGKEHTVALAALILALNISFGGGLLLGGVFSVSSVGYKGIHYFTFAVGASIAVVLYFIIIPIETTDEAKKMKLKNLDYYGSALLVAGILLIILGFTEAAGGWKKPSVYLPLPLGVLILAAALVFEMVYIQRFKDKLNRKFAVVDEETADLKDTTETRSVPRELNDWRNKLEVLFPREVLSVPNFGYYIVAAAVNQISFSSILTQLVQYWIYVKNDTPLIASVKTLSTSFGLLASWACYREDVVYKIGMKWVLILTQLVCIGCSIWISRHEFSNPQSYWIYELVPMFVYPFFGSMFFFVYYSAIFRRTPPHLQGVVSGLLSTVSQVAISLQNSIVAAILGELFITETLNEKNELSKKFDNCFYMSFGCLTMGLLMILLVDNQKTVDGETNQEEGEEELGEITMA